MISVDVTVKNLEGFDDQFDEIFKAIDANLSEVASVVKQEADASTEFKDKTGYLRQRNKKRKSLFEDGGYIVYNRSPHAHLVEYGHVKMLPVKGADGKWVIRTTGERVPAHPFMRKALERGIDYTVTHMPTRSEE